MLLSAARDYLLQKRGYEFDPACVDAFLARWDEVEMIVTGKAAAPQPVIDESERETALSSCS